MTIPFLGTAQKVQDETSKNDKVEIKHLTKADFIKQIWDYEKNRDEWIYKGKKPCIIDFYTTWCGPCKQLAPKLEELASEYKGEIIIYKINQEQERELSALFGVSSIPTLLFIPKEGKPQMAKGNLPKETLVKIINEVLLVKQNK